MTFRPKNPPGNPCSPGKSRLRNKRACSLVKNLPRDIKEFLNRLNRNQFKIDLEHRGLDRLVTDLDRSSNRIAFAVVIGSLIVGSSLIMQTNKGPTMLGFPVLGFLGYSVAGLLGLWLAIGILRSGRL